MHKSMLPRSPLPTLEPCEICPGNPKCSSLNHHIKFVHCTEAPPLPYYHCEKCTETFFTQRILEQHICKDCCQTKTHIKDFTVHIVAGTGYEKKNNLLQHIKERHSPNPPSYKCEKCDFSTYRKWNLNLHLCNPDRG